MTQPVGILGGQLTPAQPPGRAFVGQIISATVADPRGVEWILNLAAWRSVGAVTRNQTGVGDSRGVRAKIRWGGGGQGGSAQEVAEIDYPASGTTVAVHGTSIQVEVNGVMPTDATQAPTLAAWVGVRGAAAAHQMEATLTEDPIAILVGQARTFDVPSRARAFRIVGTAGNRGSNIITGTQRTGNITPTDIQIDILINGATNAEEFTGPAARSRWYPMRPDAQGLRIDNLSGAVTDVTVQWLIELS